MSTSSRVYLDHFASTPMLDEAVAAMLEELAGPGANPSGVHAPSRAVRRALDDARDDLAEVLGCRGGEVVFTSGGTEANNLALYGTLQRRGGSLVTSAIEHHSVLLPALELGARVVSVTIDAIIDLEDLARNLDDEVELVSVMAVNNEVGVVEPLDAVIELVERLAPRALVHTDAVQAVGYEDIATLVKRADLVSIAGHKFGGPKGIGALVVRERARARLSPHLVGGSQERALRAGTENVAGAVAMATAARITTARRFSNTTAVRALRDELTDGLTALSPRVVESVRREFTIAASCHVRFCGIASEELLFVLDELGVAASSGAACASGALEPSHVLMAMGWSETEASEGIRFSLGATTTKEEIDQAIEVARTALSRLDSSTGKWN